MMWAAVWWEIDSANVMAQIVTAKEKSAMPKIPLAKVGIADTIAAP